jgi:uncharacterized protein YkwD
MAAGTQRFGERGWRALAPALAALVALTLASVVASPAQAHRARAAQACAHAGELPAQITTAQARAAVLCLLNRERGRRDLRPLHDNAHLRHAAQGHSRDMAHRHYFEHDTPDGRTMVDRVRAAGYLRAGRSWAVGENIAWGSGSWATPAHIVDMWMHSPGHRANILNGAYREIGIGIVRRAPVDGVGEGATYTTDFGVVG